METIIAILAGTALGTLIGFVYARSRNREMQNTIDRLDWQLKGEKANAEQYQTNNRVIELLCNKQRR